MPDSLLRVLTCGSVDDGKSTLIGRLLFECGSIPDDVLVALERDSRRFGTVEEVTALVCWLCSEEASFSTAAVFDVSGGRATY